MDYKSFVVGKGIHRWASAFTPRDVFGDAGAEDEPLLLGIPVAQGLPREEESRLGAVPAGFQTAKAEPSDERLRDVNENRDPAWLMGWLALDVIVFMAASVAATEGRRLLLKSQKLLETALLQWLIAGVVLMMTVLHQTAICWALDLDFYLCDLAPLSVLVGAATLMLAPGGSRHRTLQMMILAAPATVCVAAILMGEYVAPFGAFGHRAPLAERIEENLRVLHWPVLWLGFVVIGSWAYAIAKRSGGLGHFAAILTMVFALLCRNVNPQFLELSYRWGGGVLLVYWHALAVRERDTLSLNCALVYMFLYLLVFVPPGQDAEFWCYMLTVDLGIVGCVGLAYWALFPDWLSPWQAHLGACLLEVSLVIQNLVAFELVPVGLVFWTTVLTALLLFTFGRLHGFKGYYVLSSILLVVSPGRPTAEAGAEMGSPAGWVLILSAFVVLGAGVLVSMLRCREEPALG